MESYMLSINNSDRVLYSTTNFEDLKNFLDPNKLFSYDIESNARRLYSVGYEIVGFSVANDKNSGLYVCFESLDKSMDIENKKLVNQFIIDSLLNHKSVVHNMQHERGAIRSFYNIEIPYESMDDTLFMSRLLLGGKSGSGLKYQAQWRLSYPDWDTDLNVYFNQCHSLLDSWYKLGVTDITDEIVESSTIMKELLESYGYTNIKELFQLLLDKSKKIYPTIDDIPEVLSYGLVPYNLIKRYGAMDALATIELNYYYHNIMVEQSELPELDLLKGYEMLRKQGYAGYILERNGAFFNDDLVEEVLVDSRKRTLEALIRMIKNPILYDFIDKKAYDKYLLESLVRYPEYGLLSGILVEKGPDGKYNVKLNGKRAARGKAWDVPKTDGLLSACRELLYEELDNATSVDDLKPIYNPKSVTDNRCIISCLLKCRDFYYAKVVRELSQEFLYSNLYDPEIKESVDKLDVLTKYKCISIYNDTLQVNDIIRARENNWYKNANNLATILTDRLLEIAKDIELPEESIEYLQVSRGKAPTIINELAFNKVIKMGIYASMTEVDHCLMELALTLNNREQKDTFLNEDKPNYNEEYELFKSLLDTGITYDKDYNIIACDNNIHCDIIKRYCIKVKKELDELNTLHKGVLAELSIFLVISGINLDNEKLRHTNEYMNFLMDMTIYVRLIKLITAYIEGDKLGRPTVSIVNKEDLENGISTNRLRSYNGRPKENESTLMNSKFSVATADTLRWQAGLHTLQYKSVSKKFYSSRYEGGTILCPDYSQNEVRCLASTSGCKPLLDAFLRGADPHRATAALIFRKPESEVNGNERRYAKTATFSILYGASIRGFADNFCFGDMNKAEEIIGRFYEAYPEIKTWIDKMHKSAIEKGFVPTLMNAKITIDPDSETGKYGSRQLRNAQNAPIQSASSCIAGCVLFEMCRWIENEKLLTKPFLFVHDSLEFDCHPYEFIKVVTKLGIALNEIPIRDYSTPVHAELSLGKSLGHELETEISVEGDPNTATECILVLNGIKSEIYETIEEWKKVYDIEILDEWYDSEDADGNKVRVDGYKPHLISWTDVFCSRRPFNNMYGTYEYSGNCKLSLKYKLDKYNEYINKFIN